MKAGFQGTEGSYSHQALNLFFKESTENIISIGFNTFEDVFRAIKDKEIDYAFLPVENSIAGSVAPVYDLLLKEDVYAISEFYFEIRHNLLGVKGSNLSDIKTVYSHPVALNQCRDFIFRNSFKPTEKYDTAGAAYIVSSLGDKSVGAIASRLCKDIYDLDILAENIASNSNNFTKFFLVVRKEEKKEIIGNNKISMVFKPKHTEKCGALVSCLDIFSKYDVNLTKVESRPDPESIWEYVFYIDLEASIDDYNFKKCLLVLEDFTYFYKILGDYKSINRK